jgi:uncharacterized protein (DUF924 family)
VDDVCGQDGSRLLMTTPEDILSYWFGDAVDQAEVARQRRALWWGKSAATDAEITARFGAVHARAVAGQLGGWRAEPRSLLALIVLIDQFSRVICRGQPSCFANDTMALELALDGTAGGKDRRLRPIERVFFYLPFEHAESLEMQRRAVREIAALCDDVDDVLRPTFSGFLDYAERHLAVIERFGRFPHRNAILGRASTAEEDASLQEPGASF